MEINSQVQLLDLQKILKSTTKDTAEKKQLDSKTANQKNTEFDKLIHFGDLIDIDVIGSSEYDWRGKITNEGFLDGIEFTDDEIFALCKSGEQIARKVAQSYGKFLRDPKIIVTILDRSNRPNVTLYGAVKKPQNFKLTRKVRLNELIILAGGFTEKASGLIQVLRQERSSCITKLGNENELLSQGTESIENVKKINRENSTKFIDIKISDILSGNAESNIEILYGDLIAVKVAQPIYVIGGVTNPTNFPLREKITASRAISIAGGLTNNADRENITIFRREDGETKIIKINLRDIAEQKANDVELKAYDIVDVAENGRKDKLYPPLLNLEDNKFDSFTKLPLTIIKK